MDTESKLNKLGISFPYVEKDVLLDLLVSCEGSVEKTIRLLTGEKSDTQEELRQTTTCKEEKYNTETKQDFQESVFSNNSQNAGTKRKITDLISHNKRCKIDPTSTNKTIRLVTKETIEAELPNIKVYFNFLPDELADEVLKSLDSQRMLFKAKQFYIAGNLCTSSQKSIFYSNESEADYDPVYASTEFKTNKYTPPIHKCKMYVDNKVNEILEELFENDQSKPEYMISKNWVSDFCVGNYYPNNKSHLDWHSDKLTNIGPLPTIASVTFGCTRIFRLRRSNPSNSVIYNIPLPNNTLVLMLPSTQELYKHSVPTLKDSMIKKSKISGPVRYNLTFRMQYPHFKDNYVLCDKCKQKMILRRLFKGEDIGYYVWMCMSSFKGNECKGFKYANFKIVDGKMELSTKDKNEATRWLNDYEEKTD
jgi:alkylated DNA repair dioxygenase AlkB